MIRMLLGASKSGEEEIQVERVLITDRVPDTKDLGLDKVGIILGNDRVLVNNHMETNVHGVYAVGDLTGSSFASIAFAGGIVAAENAMGVKSVIDYKAVSRCIFTTPEVACVGLTEEEAIELKYNIKIGRFSFRANAGALTIGESTGLVKMITEAKTGEVLGVHIIGSRATDLIAEATLAINLEATVEEIINTIHAHPTPSEALWEAALDVNDAAIHK